MSNEKNLGPKNNTFEQREVLLNNIDHSMDAQNFKYQNIQQIYLMKVSQEDIFEVKCYKDFINV